MIHGKKLAVVMPAYNAAKTLKRTYDHLPHEIVDDVILVDDHNSVATRLILRMPHIGAPEIRIVLLQSSNLIDTRIK